MGDYLQNKDINFAAGTIPNGSESQASSLQVVDPNDVDEWVASTGKRFRGVRVTLGATLGNIIVRIYDGDPGAATVPLRYEATFTFSATGETLVGMLSDPQGAPFYHGKGGYVTVEGAASNLDAIVEAFITDDTSLRNV